MDKGLLADATSTDDSPVSGYMLKEIARATITSYPACNQLIDYLGTRIKKNNRNVKYKCCVIIKHVCREGRVEFKREVSRILDSIKECCQFKGEVDSLRGDEPNRQVRDAAKEALDAIFDSQMPVTVSSVAGAGRIQAFGGGYDESQYASHNQPASSGSTSYLKSISDKMSSMLSDDGAAYQGHPGATDMTPDGSMGRPGGSYPQGSQGSYGGPAGAAAGSYGVSSGGGYESRGPSGMQGFGSGPDPRDEKSWTQKLSDAAFSAKDKIGGLRSGPASETSVRFANDSSNYSNYNSNRGVNAHGREISNTYNPNTSSPSNASALNGASSGPYGHGTPPPIPSEPPALEPGSGGMVPDMPNRPGYGRAGSAAQDGTYEFGVVAALCEPGGMKAVPPQDKLTKFLHSAQTLSPEVVGSCLLGQLNEESWQTRVKALMVISSLSLADGCGAHRGWWVDVDRMDELRMIGQSDPKTSVRSQAIKTLRSLGEGVDSAAEAAKAAPRKVTGTVIQHQAPISLLDYDDEPAPAATSNSMSEFDPLGMAAPQFQPPQQQVYSQPPPVPMSAPAAESVSDGGLFDGMDMGMSSVAPAQHSPAVQSAVAAVARDPHVVASMSNLLNDRDPYSSAVAPPAQTSNVSSVFDDLIDCEPVIASVPASKFSAFADLEPQLGSGSAAPTGMYMGNSQPSQGIYGQPPQGMYGQPPQGTYSQPPHLTRPIQGGQLHQQQYHGQGQGYPGGYPGGQAGGYPGTGGYQQYQVGSMGSAAAPRKQIPDGPSAGGSGFSFMSGGAAKGSGDSFSFVSDAMKSSGGVKKK